MIKIFIFNNNVYSSLPKLKSFRGDLNVKFTKKNFASSINYNIIYDPAKDYYRLLNIEDNAKSSEIKKAFYSLSIKHHPDKGGKEKDFKMINQAYEVLKSEDERKVYDRLRKEHLDELNSKLNFTKTNKATRDNYGKQTKPNSDREYQYNYKGKTSYKYQNNKSESEFYSHYKEDFSHDSSFRDSDFERTYKDFIDLLKKYSHKYSRNTNSFDQFKINVKYIPLEKQKLYAELKLDLTHKHHMLNRIRKYQAEVDKKKEEEKSKNFINFKKNKKEEMNPFEIYNDMYKDEDFKRALNSKQHLEDDESLKSKFTFKEIFKVFNNKSVYSFLLLNAFLLLIFFKH